MKRKEVNINDLSPMMKQYMEIKNNYDEELLFFRLGDFYELFFEDAEIASRELELTLTGKMAGLKERIPMCGVPHHSVKPYIEKLVNNGYKIAICEQLEDAKSTKGMVKRGVVQVISKGTLVDLESLNSYEHNYIASVLDFKHSYVLTYADISTGDLFVSSIVHDINVLLNELLNLQIKELIIIDSIDLEFENKIENIYGISITKSDNYLENDYEYLYKDLDDPRLEMGIKHLLYYLVVRELKDLTHIKNIEIINREEYLEMDVHTVNNLELIETMRNKERMYSLVWLLDKAKTAMGSRKIKKWLMNPLVDKKSIEERHNLIEKLNTEFILKEKLREALYNVYDLERLCAKVTCGNLNARDVLQMKKSLKVLPEIKEIKDDLGFDFTFDVHQDLYNILEEAIYEDPPITLKEGYLIKDGYNKELDELKEIRSGGKQFISNLEESEREKTGIKNLKVGYNKVFGYFIEITKGQVKNIDSSWGWDRRQTLTDRERYITPLLKEKEALILNAEEKIVELEYNMFLEIKNILKENVISLKGTSSMISELDALASLSVVAEECNFIKPVINENNIIDIENGRHPVVEKMSKIEYVPNDCLMDENTTTLLITGPNMSGKSTYMRQLAIIIILNQMGSFVPATKAVLPIFDKIFTRIGASDDLVSGESTFMVEMLEAKNAITNATKNSLILFDELGRGTATYDGMSIAESILEYVNKKIKCKTLFSTHYHEMTKLDQKIPSIKNIHVSAHEENGKLTFLHKIKDGPVDKSYGLEVARLAGMPDEVIKRAHAILNSYETNKPKLIEQISFELPDEEDKLRTKLNDLNPLEITPLEAMNILYELKKMSRE